MKILEDVGNGYHHGRTNPGRQVARATTFCTVAPNICGSSVWNLLHVTLQVPRILKNVWTSGYYTSYNDYPARAASFLSNEVAFPPHPYKAWWLYRDEKSRLKWCHFLYTYVNGCRPATTTQSLESEGGIFATPHARPKGSAIITGNSLIRWWQHLHTTWKI
jgi:hypothetical protein